MAAAMMVRRRRKKGGGGKKKEKDEEEKEEEEKEEEEGKEAEKEEKEEEGNVDTHCLLRLVISGLSLGLDEPIYRGKQWQEGPSQPQFPCRGLLSPISP